MLNVVCIAMAAQTVVRRVSAAGSAVESEAEADVCAERNFVARFAPSTSKRVSLERRPFVVAHPRSCMSVLSTTVSALMRCSGGILLAMRSAKALARRQWFTTAGAVCSFVYVRAEAMSGVEGRVILLMGRGGKGDGDGEEDVMVGGET